MSSITITPQASAAAAHYKRPGWFTTHVFNNVGRRADPPGRERLGLPGARAPGPHQRRPPPHPGQPAEPGRNPVPGVAPGRDPVGAQRAPLGRPHGADPGPAPPDLPGHRDPAGRGRAGPAGLPAPSGSSRRASSSTASAPTPRTRSGRRSRRSTRSSKSAERRAAAVGSQRGLRRQRPVAAGGASFSNSWISKQTRPS